MSCTKALVTFIIVNWNTREPLRACLESIPGSSDRFRQETVVVDNASVDGSVDMVRAEFPHATLVANKKNLGYSAAFNQGVNIGRGNFFVLMNPDVRLQPLQIDRLLDFAERIRGVGAITGVLVSKDGNRQRYHYRCRSSLIFILMSEMSLGRILGTAFLGSKFDSFLYLGDRHFRRPVAVPFVGTSCIIVPRETILKLRYLFDERFPLYWGDVDFCRRLHETGLKICVLPEVKISHRGGASVPMLCRLRVAILFFGGLLMYYYLHESRIRLLMLRGMITFTTIMEILIYLGLSPFRKQWKREVGWRIAFLLVWLTWPTSPRLSSYLPSTPRTEVDDHGWRKQIPSCTDDPLHVDLTHAGGDGGKPKREPPFSRTTLRKSR